MSRSSVRTLFVAASLLLCMLGASSPSLVRGAEQSRRFVNLLSNKCMEVAGNLTPYDEKQQDGATIQQWDCNSAAWQKWYVRSAGVTSGGVNKYNIVNTYTNRCLEIRGNVYPDPAINQKLQNGAYAQQWVCGNNYEHQQWTFTGTGTNFRIKNVYSGKCLEIYYQTNNNGEHVEQWDCNGTATQNWGQTFFN